MKHIRILSATFALGLALAAGQTEATPITVNNADFDSPNGGSGVGSDAVGFFSTYKWNGTPASGHIGLYVSSYNDPSGVTSYRPADSGHGGLAYMEGSFTGQLWQTTGALFENGTYTLSVQTALTPSASPYAWPSDVEIQLYAGTNPVTGTLLKQISIPNPGVAASFQTNALTFGPADASFSALFAAHQLEPLTISFYYSASVARSEVDLDNVTFDFVPEPSAAALLAMGAVLLHRRVK